MIDGSLLVDRAAVPSRVRRPERGYSLPVPAPITIPDSLTAALTEEVERAKVPLHRQVEALAELFDLFTRDRRDLPGRSYLDTPRHRLAYLRYHLPVNFARAAGVLRDLAAAEPRIADLDHVVDLGAGPGSASLAALLTLPRSEDRRFILTDRSRAALRLASSLLTACAAREGIEAPRPSCVAERLPSLPRIPPRSLVLLAMVLNELRGAGGRGIDTDVFLAHLDRAMIPGSVLVIIEPALRAPGRELLRVHDALAGSGRWRVLAPCTHQRACPLLRLRDRPWCHFHLELRSPRLVRDVARPLGLDHQRVSLAYLAVEKLAVDAPAAEQAPAADRARVIGDPMRVRGETSGIYICREGRRETLAEPPAGTGRGDTLRRRRGKGRRQTFELERRWAGREG